MDKLGQQTLRSFIVKKPGSEKLLYIAPTTKKANKGNNKNSENKNFP